MVRVKRGLMTKKRHKKILKATKWYRMLNSKVFRRAKNAWMKAGLNAYIGRKRKKRDFGIQESTLLLEKMECLILDLSMLCIWKELN